MANNINNLFAATMTAETTIGSRGLAGTAELTRLAATKARTIIETMNEDAENYAERIQRSTTDAAELDKLIDELVGDFEDEAQFLAALDERTVDGMLKSQQSKRSRSKSKTMTLDNYTTMMTAAVAEHIIRHVTGKIKGTSSRYSSAGTVEYTAEQLEALGADQDKLRKEIRNIQSKKSIMKGRNDFDENDERWLSLLKAEQSLKDMRISAAPQVVKVDETKDAVNEMLADVDISKLNSKDAHDLLAKISEMIQ